MNLSNYKCNNQLSIFDWLKDKAEKEDEIVKLGDILYSVKIDKITEWEVIKKEMSNYIVRAGDNTRYFSKDNISILYKTKSQAQKIANDNMKSFCDRYENAILTIANLTEYKHWSAEPRECDGYVLTAEIGIDETHNVVYWRNFFTYAFAEKPKQGESIQKTYKRMLKDMMQSRKCNYQDNIEPDIEESEYVIEQRKLYWSQQYARYGDIDYGYYATTGEMYTRR